jgi:sulfate adenylyltransferase
MIDAHGGALIDRVLQGSVRERRLAEAESLPVLHPHIDQVYDAEKIAIGAYSPLSGFMDKATFESILTTRRLPGGLPWTIPIVFAPADPRDAATVAGLGQGDAVALVDSIGRRFAVLTVSETFGYDKGRYAEATFLTKDPAHPNVADILAAGPTAVAGTIELLHRLDLPVGRFELTPVETRREFARLGWNHVAAYQCRNPPHTAHEYLQRCTLDREDVDGLFIHPVVGRLKKGDYLPDVIMACYEALVNNYYPKERVLLSSLTVTMRYAGPNAALFYAIVRKNYGCDRYIVGRDQAGVGKYYDPFACHRIFDELPLDILPVRYPETFYCRSCGGMATTKTCVHPASARVSTAQTLIREKLKKGEPLPPEVLRPEVAAILSRGGEILND